MHSGDTCFPFQHSIHPEEIKGKEAWESHLSSETAGGIDPSILDAEVEP